MSEKHISKPVTEDDIFPLAGTGQGGMMNDNHQCYLDCVDSGGDKKNCFLFCYTNSRPNKQNSSS